MLKKLAGNLLLKCSRNPSLGVQGSSYMHSSLKPHEEYGSKGRYWLLGTVVPRVLPVPRVGENCIVAGSCEGLHYNQEVISFPFTVSPLFCLIFSAPW